MTTPRPEQDAAPETDMQAALTAAGIVVTPEGRARARAKLDAADAYWTPERREQARRDFYARMGIDRDTDAA
jgi:hypothetical protein